MCSGLSLSPCPVAPAVFRAVAERGVCLWQTERPLFAHGTVSPPALGLSLTIFTFPEEELCGPAGADASVSSTCFSTLPRVTSVSPNIRDDLPSEALKMLPQHAVTTVVLGMRWQLCCVLTLCSPSTDGSVGHGLWNLRAPFT